MTNDSLAGSRTPRLNPFVFPSDTDFRFVLLIVSVVGSSLFIYEWFYWNLFGKRAESALERCRDRLQADNPATNIDELAARTQALNTCMEPLEQHRFPLIVGGVVLLLTVAGIIYWTAPARKIRRDRLVPISDQDIPEIRAYLGDLCKEARLSHPPTFLWDPPNLSNSGLAFGRRGRYYVALTGGLVAQFYTDRPAFRVVVLHELAHLRNADVSKTYLTVATWQAFVAVALVPFVASLVFYLARFGNLSFVFKSVWGMVALAALVYLMRNAVLRARESYADVRASEWEGASDTLERVLATIPNPAAGRWRSIARVHPDSSERQRTLLDPSRLFRMSFWDAFAAGIAITIAFTNVASLLILPLPSQQESAATLGAAVFFTPLAIGVVGLGTWRGTFAALAQGETPSGMGVLGLGLGSGLVLGNLLSLTTALTISPPADAGGWIGFFVFYLLWSAFLLACLFLFFRWISIGASVWLQVTTSRRSLRFAYVWGLTLAIVILAPGLSLLLQVFTFGSVSPLAPLIMIVGFGRGPLMYITDSPITYFVLASLWVFPMSAWFWRGRASTAFRPTWASLDPMPQQRTLPRTLPLRPITAVKIGSAGGLLFCILLTIGRIGLHISLPEATRQTADARGTFFWGLLAVAMLTQMGVAALAAAWVKPLGWAHGLCAAFVAGCVMTIGVVGLVELADCVGVLAFGPTYSCYGIDVGYASQVLGLLVNGGALSSLPVAVGVSALAPRVRHPRST